MRKFFLILLFLFPFQVFAENNENIWDWNKANLEVNRLSPEIFNILPKKIQNYLKSNNYLIPQTYDEKKPHNVISGQFIKEGQKDWAVLASKNFSSSILIFLNSNTGKENIIEILPEKDINYLQVIGENKIGFSRRILSVNKDKLAMDENDLSYYHQEYGDENPPPVTHDGICDSFVDKGSVIYYYYNGKWLRWFVSD
jgi:hypothetical protein